MMQSNGLIIVMANLPQIFSTVEYWFVEFRHNSISRYDAPRRLGKPQGAVTPENIAKIREIV